MNTSFPSAASDFASLLAGGKRSNSNSQLKGILAGLGCSRTAKADSAETGRPDFETMLETPDTAAKNAGCGGKSPSGMARQESESPTNDAAHGRCLAELSEVVTSTLQIKGMVAVLCSPVPPVLVQPEGGAAPQTSPTETEALPDSPIVGTDVADLTDTLVPSALNDVAVDGPICPKNDKISGPPVSRQIKLLPGRGQSLRGCGVNPALVVHTGTRQKNFGPAPAEPVTATPDAATIAPVITVTPPTLPIPLLNIGNVLETEIHSEQEAESADIPVVSNLMDPPTGVSSEIASSSLPVVRGAENLLAADPLVDFQIPDDSQTQTSPSTNSTVLPNATLAPDLVSVAAAPIAIFSIPTVDVLPVAAVVPATGPINQAANGPAVVVGQTTVTEGNPSLLNSGEMLAQADSLENTPVPTDFAVASVEAAPAIVETSPEVSDETASTSVTPEIRREVIETVAAMLAPFMMTLPLIQPELLPSGSPAQSDDVMTGGASAAKSLSVTVKVGTQSSFTFELPQASLSETRIDNILAESTAMEETGERPAHAPVPFLFPATTADWADANQPLDFRLQLKAAVEAAWPQLSQGTTENELTPVQPPVIQVVEAMPQVSRLEQVIATTTSSAVPEDLRTMASAVPAPEVLVPVASLVEQTPKTDVAKAPVEVTIEMPGFGSLTAQIAASASATNPLETKPATRNGREEKSAGGFKSAGTKGSREISGFEKTFLSTGSQSVKDKAGDAGTDVAISDDTMPARFTSRRVTVDQLEFPPRINAREIQPVFSQSPTFAASADTPVANTPAPVLAHRAVETILNVVEAQRQSAANASSVNLHFKFGSDDLAVRVQMRGGEVLTQFLTDSAELRSAISSEWQIMAGQGSASGLRLHEPMIVPASAGTSSGFGSATQGQNQGRQQAQQQQEQAATTMPEFHPLRHRAVAPKPLTEVSPRISITPETSQHLTATA